MSPTITAFEQSPDRGRGLARDMHVRWALEEVGQAYDVRLVSFGGMKAAAHRALHPFGHDGIGQNRPIAESCSRLLSSERVAGAKPGPLFRGPL